MRTTPASRAFTADELPDAVLHEILDHARFAPNGGNRQAWHVIVVRATATKARLAELWGLAQREDNAFYRAGLVPFVASEAYWRNPPGQPSVQPVDLEAARQGDEEATRGARPDFVARAPVVLVIAADLTRMTAMDSGLGRLSISAGASIYPFCHNILLGARNAGYGGLITSVLVRQEPAVKELLGIPDHYAVAATIPLGKPEKQITRLRRKPVAEFATVERFDGAPFTR